jgi:hypothetical protein
MNKSAGLLAALMAVLAIGYFLTRASRAGHAPPITAVATKTLTQLQPRATASSSTAPSVAAPVPGPSAVQERDNLAAPEIGGHIELVTSEYNTDDRAAIHLIDRDRPAEDHSVLIAAGGAPQEIVIGFFERQPARIAAIVIDPNTHTGASWAKDVEAWTSIESPTSGFVKVASLTLAQEDVERTMTFAPVDARFVKIRILSQQTSDREVGIGKIKVIEAREAGYTPLVVRNASLAGALAAGTADATIAPIAVAAAPLPASTAGTPVSANVCSAVQPINERRLLATLKSDPDPGTVDIVPLHDGAVSGAAPVAVSAPAGTLTPFGFSVYADGTALITSAHSNQDGLFRNGTFTSVTDAGQSAPVLDDQGWKICLHGARGE